MVLENCDNVKVHTVLLGPLKSTPRLSTVIFFPAHYRRKILQRCHRCGSVLAAKVILSAASHCHSVLVPVLNCGLFQHNLTQETVLQNCRACNMPPAE